MKSKLQQIRLNPVLAKVITKLIKVRHTLNYLTFFISLQSTFIKHFLYLLLSSKNIFLDYHHLYHTFIRIYPHFPF